MASSAEKKKRKIAKSAIPLRAEARKARNQFFLAMAITIVALLVYFVATLMGIIADNPFVSSLVIIVAVVVGMFSIKSSRAKSRYRQYLDQNNLTDDEVREEQSYQ